MLVESLTELFKMISDSTRLKILIALSIDMHCVCELQVIIGESQPKISKHLTRLRDSGFVSCQKKEQFIYYKLEKNEMLELIIQEVIEKIEDYDDLKPCLNNYKV